MCIRNDVDVYVPIKVVNCLFVILMYDICKCITFFFSIKNVDVYVPMFFMKVTRELYDPDCTIYDLIPLHIA